MPAPTGAMVGLDVPVLPVEHQFIVTEPHPEVVARHEAGLPEMGVLRESDGSWDLREERAASFSAPMSRARLAATWMDLPMMWSTNCSRRTWSA